MDFDHLFGVLVFIGSTFDGVFITSVEDTTFCIIIGNQGEVTGNGGLRVLDYFTQSLTGHLRKHFKNLRLGRCARGYIIDG